MIKIKTIYIIIISYLYTVHILHWIYNHTLAQHQPYEKALVLSMNYYGKVLHIG